MGLLNVSGIVAGYTAADEILKGVDFTVTDGEIVCIIGPNGAGKSTLLKTIAGLLHPSQGAIELRGSSLARLPPREITRLGVAYVPQEHNIFPTMSVRENLEIGGYVDAARIAARIETVMQRFPMLARKLGPVVIGGTRRITEDEPALLLVQAPQIGNRQERPQRRRA